MCSAPDLHSKYVASRAHLPLALPLGAVRVGLWPGKSPRRHPSKSIGVTNPRHACAQCSCGRGWCSAVGCCRRHRCCVWCGHPGEGHGHERDLQGRGQEPCECTHTHPSKSCMHARLQQRTSHHDRRQQLHSVCIGPLPRKRREARSKGPCRVRGRKLETRLLSVSRHGTAATQFLGGGAGAC